MLDGICFEVKKGEAIGLIGHNGCGKSTTLKLLTKIMYPDKGKIEMRGRVSSLIELGAGFHPDMSGRENIYILSLIHILKADAMISNSETLLASESGYILPANYGDYAENKDKDGNVIVPKLTMDVVDKVLKICKENGIKVRVHMPMWHLSLIHI